MDSAFLRLVRVAVPAALLYPLLLLVCSQLHFRIGVTTSFLGQAAVLGVSGLAVSWIVLSWLGRHRAELDANAIAQVERIDAIPERSAWWAIFVAAAVSLVLELVMIRWQGTVFKFFAIFKNIGLLSCFVGLGLGYAMAGRRGISLALVLPLFLLQVAMMMALKHGLGWRADQLLTNPVKEQLQMGLRMAQGLAQYAIIYVFMAVTFLVTALTFIPIGQLCGRTMRRRPTLDAYGWNLLGSFVGVVVTFLIAAAWTPPVVWFALAFLPIFYFLGHSGRASAVGAACALVGLTLLSIQLPFGSEKIYSPYQLIERGPSEEPSMDGLSTLTVSGEYYQRILNLSAEHRASHPASRQIGYYYDLPYRVRGEAVGRVAVMGAGTGNDVAAALRAGAAEVDAIEIDPAILEMGRLYHPEKPYSDARVNALVNDARTHLRTTDRAYDMIVYGMLDAQTLLSHGSSVRLDSFVYTVEALREARARLNEGGLICLSFAVCSEGQGRKMFKMVQEAFDGRAPVCVRTDLDVAIFLIGKNENPDLSHVDLAAIQFEDATEYFGASTMEADVSTDDWPFLYMQKRVYPISYVTMLIIVPLLSLLLIGWLMRGGGAGAFGHLSFLFLGAGFMLVETKGITELGLTFGNTWHVIGIVIMGVLGMAYLANLVVEKTRVERLTVPYVLLILSLAGGYWVAKTGGFGSDTLGRIASVVILTCPLFFSGIVFSTTLNRTGNVAGAMATNLFGAMLGGLLEYNSMYFGFQFLYLLGIALYGLALLTTVIRPLRTATAAT